MATRLKPTRINVDNTPRVGDGAAYQNDNDFHWSMGGGDMTYRDFEWHTLTGTSLVIEDISNNITPSSNFTVSAGTVKPGIEYVLRVNTGNTPYTMTLGTGVTNPNGYSTELTPNKVNQFKFIATSDSQLELEGVDTSDFVTLGTQQTITAKKTFDVEPELGTAKTTDATNNGTKFATEAQVYKKLDSLTILSYGNSTWNDFITAYNKNAVIYCRASSNSNPATGAQNRLAFMAYVNNATNPTEVEFQYYRSRSSHSTAQNQQDEVYVYKLTSTSGGTWTVEVRDTAAKAIAGTGIGLTFNSSGMTISADTSVLATKTDLNSKQDTLVSGTNIKTINSNSLLGSGNLTLNDVKVSATAPSSPTEGMVWYDTTNDQLKVYDGTNWNVTGKEYNAGPGISIGDVTINGRKGPSPYGFHVPSAAELEGVETIMDGLSLTTGDSWRINLHMPFAGYRDITGATIHLNGTRGFYWSSTPYSTDSDSSRYLSLNSSSVDTTDSQRRGLAYSIRCFRDSYVVPTASWTVVQGTLGGAGIFWNQSEGLISITDGTSGYTIMDKNLGATTVYNDGDTLTQDNMGNMYQWGNNYGFPSTGTISNTSSTQVDASGYGPSTANGYYKSDTFITGSLDWSSVQNDDLWGDTTGIITQENVISNTGVLSVNGQTGAVTINEGDVKVFEVPAVNDDISDMITRLSAGKGVILHEMVSGTDAFYKVDYHDDVTQEITASLIYSYNGGYARFYTIVYNNSTKKVSTKTSSLTYFFAPETAGTQGQVLTKTNSGYEWAAPQGTTYNAGEGIEIGTIQDYSAMQGPAPDGFHVPSKDEWTAVKTVWTTLGGGSSDGTNFGIALKLPFAGYRFSSSAGVGSQGSYGFYWSSSRNNTNNAYLLNFNSSDVLPQNANYRAFGYSVRCFKNSPTVPTSSWTKLYGTSIEAGGIFWSSTEGLISMSSDGQTWITIQDKNLGATTVWNSGDTLSEANCGKYYQRGNNYGFPRTGSVTTSSTQVDASTYGPGNYYSSSTFITRNSSPYRWDTTDNGNLWGGVTGVVTYDNAIINTGVLSVNGQTGNVTIEAFQLAPNSPLTPKYRRYGTQAQYEALAQYYTDEPGDTVYFTI